MFQDNQFSESIKESTKLILTSDFNIGGTSILQHVDEESNKISVITLSALLGSIYGLAFIMGIIWVIWLWIRRRAHSATSFKSSNQINSSRTSTIGSLRSEM